MGYPDEGQVVSSVLLTPVSSMFQTKPMASSRFASQTEVSSYAKETLDIDPSAKFSVLTAFLRDIAVSVNFPELHHPHEHPIPDTTFGKTPHEPNLVIAFLSLSHNRFVVPSGVTLVVDPSGKLLVLRRMLRYSSVTMLPLELQKLLGLLLSPRSDRVGTNDAVAGFTVVHRSQVVNQPCEHAVPIAIDARL